MALIRSLCGHATLRSLTLDFSLHPHPADMTHVAAPVAEVLAADAPALHTLSLTAECQCEHLLLLFEALRRNTHLRELRITLRTNTTAKVVRQHVIPALEANASLRLLKLNFWRDYYLEDPKLPRALQAAMDLVAARGA